MDEALKSIIEYGVTTFIALAVIVASIQTFRGITAVAKTYFSSDGVVTKWFIQDAESRGVMSHAMDEMPKAILSLENSANAHHKIMQEGMVELVEIQKTSSKNICAFHSNAEKLDGLFSTHFTNKGLIHCVHAARDYLEHNDVPHALAELEKADKCLHRGLGARDIGD